MDWGAHVTPLSPDGVSGIRADSVFCFCCCFFVCLFFCFFLGGGVREEGVNLPTPMDVHAP